jgi:predicted porin
MRKSILLVAAAASATAAHAQSSVTVFGVLDVGLAQVKNTGSAAARGVVTGGNSTGRLGFRGTEDLGDGLTASFWLEGEVQADTGGAAGFSFQRRSTVSLAGKSGEARLGRDYTPVYYNMLAFDVYSQRGMGIIEYFGPTVAAAQGGAFSSGGAAFNYFRNSNSLAYFLPASLGGWYGSVQYSFGERASNTPTSATNSARQGDSLGGRLGYSAGPLDVGVSYMNFHDVSRAASYVDDYTVFNVGASYNFGVVKVLTFVQQERLDGRGVLPDFKFNTYAIGASIPVGSGLIRGAVSKYDNKTSTAIASGADATKFAMGYVYSLSKRTALYADVARVSNKGSATFQVGGYGSSISGVVAPVAGGKSTGLAVGIRHSF